MNPEQIINNSSEEPNSDVAANIDIQKIRSFGIPESKTRKEWYQTENPELRSYITGNLSANISGDGSASLQRAANEYQHLSEKFARKSLSSKAMSKKYDRFNGIDSSLLDLALENENNKLQDYQDQFNSGEMGEFKFNRLSKRQQRRIDNLNENYNTLAEVSLNKRGVPLVRTQSSVSSLPFLLGTIGLPAATIGLISGGAAAAPYVGKALANPWVQRGLTGLDAVDTGVSLYSGDYLGAAANLIPGDKIAKYANKLSDNVKTVYKTYKQNHLAKQYLKNVNKYSDGYYQGNNLDKRMHATLANLYDRDRYIEKNLETGPRLRGTPSLDGLTLINGSNVATGITPKVGGIANGPSRPHFENGFYVPAKGNITANPNASRNFTEEEHPIFFSPNVPFLELPHGKTFNSTYSDHFYPDMSNPNAKRNLTQGRQWALDKYTTSDKLPYRFTETEYKPNLETGQGTTPFGVEVYVPKVPIEDVKGHEYNPLLKTFERHRYYDPNVKGTLNKSFFFNVNSRPTDIPFTHLKKGGEIPIKTN